MADRESTNPVLAPIADAARIRSLDVLRGIAVLGILMMNITGFGLLFQAYDNPQADGGAEGLNLLAYQIANVGFEGTMRGFFSLLFGASIVLLTERMEQGGAGLMTAEIHFRRMLWMMLFGIVHWALLLWTGEILFAYSMCGMLLFAVRKLSPRLQIGLAVLLLLVAAGLQANMHQGHVAEKSAAAAAEAVSKSGAKLNAEQEAAIETWKGQVEHFVPTAEDEKTMRDWREGSYWNAVTGQFPASFEFQWTQAPFWLLFDMIPFMLLGMGLLKLHVLGAQLPVRVYLAMAVAGYGIGVPLGMYEMRTVVGSGFEPLSFTQANQTYELSRLAMVMGHLGVALLFIRSGRFGVLQKALAATGQMALSNYLAQTLICTAIFYSFGFGLGLFSDLERHQLYYVVAAIWVAQLIWSPLWLSRFRFGPFEWLWRSLTYWKRQPMRVG